MKITLKELLMERTQLISLFKKYLNRDPLSQEFTIHGTKDYGKFELEISKCEEYLGLQNRPNLVGHSKKNLAKIAILISGHVRNININKSLSHLSGYDYDVFIHTWDNIGIKGSETNLEDRVDINLVKDRILKIPNLRSYKIENNKNFIGGLKPVDFNYFNWSSPEVFIKSQLYSINQCFSIFEEYQSINNKEYDLVIRTRFENEFTEFLVDEELLNDIKQKIIFVPNNGCGHEHPDSNSTTCLVCEKMYTEHNFKKVHSFEHTHIICDIFAYGSTKSMKKYCSLYENYDNLNKSFEEKNRQVLQENGIKHKFENNVCYLDINHKGHLESLYYINCSYPERLLQTQLQNYLLPTSKKIKIKWNRR